MDKVVVWTIGLTAVLLVDAALFGSQRAEPADTIAIDDPARPIATVSETHFDLGVMGMTEERERTVTITNSGASLLSVGPASTSCDCTFARLTMPDGEVSPEFSMHGMSRWSGELAPGETAEAAVIYRPSVMPVQGQVERSVLIQTNDPVNPTLQISFTATVE